MVVSVNAAIVSTFVTRKPFKSVGLVCTCGQAVAGIEGVVASCSRCGTLYLVSVMVIRAADSPQEPS